MTPGWPPLEEEARRPEMAGRIEPAVVPRPASRALDELDVELLLVALVPDLDTRFERLYGYLNDDVTRRRATIGLGLELCGMSAWSAKPGAVSPRRTADRRRAATGGGARPALPVALAPGAGSRHGLPARRRPA